MTDRTAKRPGATRLPSPTPAASTLTAVDPTSWTTEQLVRALEDRGLSTSGTDAELRTRLTNDVNGA